MVAILVCVKCIKIKGKQEAGQSCRQGIPCHFFPQQVDKRQHGNAEQSTHDTPAERIHSKDGNTQGDEVLPRGGWVFSWSAGREGTRKPCVRDRFHRNTCCCGRNSVPGTDRFRQTVQGRHLRSTGVMLPFASRKTSSIREASLSVNDRRRYLVVADTSEVPLSVACVSRSCRGDILPGEDIV